MIEVLICHHPADFLHLLYFCFIVISCIRQYFMHMCVKLTGNEDAIFVSLSNYSYVHLLRVLIELLWDLVLAGLHQNCQECLILFQIFTSDICFM